jgi:hypothetical protein
VRFVITNFKFKFKAKTTEGCNCQFWVEQDVVLNFFEGAECLSSRERAVFRCEFKSYSTFTILKIRKRLELDDL